jgi:hypothetical protein
MLACTPILLRVYAMSIRRPRKRSPPWLRRRIVTEIEEFRIATALAVLVVAIELLVISWVRNRYMDTPFLQAALQVIVGGVCVFAVGVLIGMA